MAKGQWFIISAVIASAAFLSISTLFKSYYMIDSTEVMKYNEDFLFNNIKRELNKTVDYSKSLEELENNIKEFIAFVEQEMSKRGYYLEIRNETPISFSGTTFFFSLASERMNITGVTELP